MKVVDEKKDSLLGPYRVLDLADEKGFLCGRLLGDLGADVIKIEPPGGDPARNIGPFYHDIPDPEKSLYWFAFNINKRSITLNIETTDGREIFKKLAKTADFVIESFTPGYMDRLGLGYSVLSQINPRVIMTSITPFGQTGPYAHYKASDIVVMAMTGLMYACGYMDGLPIRISFPQAFLHAGAQAAAGTMLAHYHREITGEGQQVDASAQEWLPYVTRNDLMFHFRGEIIKRSGAFRVELRKEGVLKNRLVWRCKDGFVVPLLERGADFLPFVRWMDEEGMAPDFLKEIDWATFKSDEASLEFHDQRDKAIGEFILKHTKQELFEESLRRGITLFPATSIADLVENPKIREQLTVRNYWVGVEHPELDTTITYPGPFFKSSETSWKLSQRPPLIGEHNQEVYEKELGFSKETVAMLRQARVL